MLAFIAASSRCDRDAAARSRIEAALLTAVASPAAFPDTIGVARLLGRCMAPACRPGEKRSGTRGHAEQRGAF